MLAGWQSQTGDRGAIGDKASVRAEVLRRRSALTPGDLSAAEAALTQAVLGRLPADAGLTVALYVSVGTEPSTRALLDTLAARPGITVLLPQLQPDADLAWAVHTGALQRGPRGLLEPAGPPCVGAGLAGADYVFVPALAVDRAGTRLGRGGGSYDRALTRAAGPVVALLHDGELTDRLPADPHDVPVTAVVTPEAGWLALPLPVGPDWTPVQP